jgi:long-chain fatty acid transport protein
MLSADYKRIGWGSAKGYRDFGWVDQDVYAVGYQYSQDKWALRAGYNYAKSPITEAQGATAGVINTLNLLGFPAIIEEHYTVGGTFAVDRSVGIDIAVTYAPEVDERFSGMGADVYTSHSQTTATVGATFKF